MADMKAVKFDHSGDADALEVRHVPRPSPGTAMSHIAIQENLNGKAVDWLEHVTNEQYQKNEDTTF
jgi:hypothetical protein